MCLDFTQKLAMLLQSGELDIVSVVLYVRDIFGHFGELEPLCLVTAARNSKRKCNLSTTCDTPRFGYFCMYSRLFQFNEQGEGIHMICAQKPWTRMK